MPNKTKHRKKTQKKEEEKEQKKNKREEICGTGINTKTIKTNKNSKN